jgi:hypothetical protein
MIRLARALGSHRRVPLATPEECASGCCPQRAVSGPDSARRRIPRLPLATGVLKGRAGESPAPGIMVERRLLDRSTCRSSEARGLRDPTQISGALEPVFGMANRASSNGRRPDTLSDRDRI